MVKKAHWADQKLFTVAGVTVTTKGVGVATIIWIVVCIIAILIFCFICFRHRKKIAAGARRLSTAVRRSISSMRGNPEAGQAIVDVDPKQAAEEFGGTKAQTKFMQEMVG